MKAGTTLGIVFTCEVSLIFLPKGVLKPHTHIRGSCVVMVTVVWNGHGKGMDLIIFYPAIGEL